MFLVYNKKPNLTKSSCGAGILKQNSRPLFFKGVFYVKIELLKLNLIV
jgi:hypothetical protein